MSTDAPETMDWLEYSALREIGVEIDRAEKLGMTFSCESASDLSDIADEAQTWGWRTRRAGCGISPRSVALLRYYTARIECENGAATKLDHAVAKALLALYEGCKPSESLAAIRETIVDWERSPEQ